MCSQILILAAKSSCSFQSCFASIEGNAVILSEVASPGCGDSINDEPAQSCLRTRTHLLTHEYAHIYARAHLFSFRFVYTCSHWARMHLFFSGPYSPVLPLARTPLYSTWLVRISFIQVRLFSSCSCAPFYSCSYAPVHLKLVCHRSIHVRTHLFTSGSYATVLVTFVRTHIRLVCHRSIRVRRHV